MPPVASSGAGTDGWQTPPGAAGPTRPVTLAGPAGWDNCTGAPAASARTAVAGAPAASVAVAAGFTAACAGLGRQTTAAMTPSSNTTRRTDTGTRDQRGIRDDPGTGERVLGIGLAPEVGVGV